MKLASFDDFEEYESAFAGSSIDLRKLEAGRFRAKLLQLEVGPIRLAYTRHSSVIELSGTAQPGFRSFGLPMPASPPALWCRAPTSSRTVSVFDASGGFEAVTPAGFETVVFSVSAEYLARLGESVGVGVPREILPNAEVVTCEPGPMQELRQSLLRIVRTVMNDASLEKCPSLRTELEEDIPSRLLGALADRSPHPRPVALHLRQRALRGALEHIAALPNEMLGIAELCRATGASERTLRRAFTEGLGVSPNAYLRARRLNGSYRELRRGVRVNEAANHWGFWHMGQFAADYRRMFGELPSSTLASSHGRGEGTPGSTPRPPSSPR